MATGGQKQAKYLRDHETSTEERLWRSLRLLKDPRFRRQKSFDPYVLDFYSPRYTLCVELDGPFHDAEKDAIRDAWLLDHGVRTIRFKNENADPEAVMLEIERVCVDLTPRFRLRESRE